MRTLLRSETLYAVLFFLALQFSAGALQAQLVVESVSIDHGAVNVPEVTDISVTFNEAIAPVFLPGALDVLGDALPIDFGIVNPDCPVPPAGIFVFPGGCAESVSLSEDGRTVTLHSVQLELDDDHTLVVLYTVGLSGEGLAVPHVTRFSTGPSLPQGGIAGSVTATGGAAAGTILLAIQAPLDLAGDSLVVEAGIAFADLDGNYSMDFVADGTYHVIGLQIDLTEPETGLNNLMIGTVDEDGNSVADFVEVSGGAVVNGADVSTTSEGATAAELNEPAIGLVHDAADDATLGLAVGAGMDLDGTALSWIYLYTSLESAAGWAAASVGPFVFPPQLLDLGEDGDFLLFLLGGSPVPADFGDSEGAVNSYLAAGGAEFLAEYEGAIGASVLMNADLFAFIQLLLDGGLEGFLEPVKRVFDRFDVIPDIEQALSKQTGEVWVVAFIAPAGLGLHLVAMDDTGNPLLVIGSSSARENEEAAEAVATAWANDVSLVTASTSTLPIDGRGNTIVWDFNYYSPSKDSVFTVSSTGGDRGGVISAFAIGKEEVPSVSALPVNWIDSPAAVEAARSRGEAFAQTHADATATAVLSKGLQLSNPDLPIWRFTFVGTSATGVTETLDIDLDAGSGLFVAVEDDPVVPAAFALGQNYPNPFNPSTNIPYSLGERGRVTLEVFDALGRRVATLFDGVQPAGAYAVSWDAARTFGAGAPSGVYLYRLRAEGKVVTRTMMLIK
ncbi:MAG TPA: FlgD immunoglobulin-like domain containing protein [Rhodothermales bacterium]|nr:FlgD immunoglobulin-like domain containing protein [Rhodothermales bacterium]